MHGNSLVAMEGVLDQQYTVLMLTTTQHIDAAKNIYDKVLTTAMQMQVTC